VPPLGTGVIAVELGFIEQSQTTGSELERGWVAARD
jgi:hypothetical protein